MLHKFYDIKSFEIDLISKTNRFKITTSQKKEILIKFKNKNHLIIGAAGSIGSVFSKLILLYKPYKVFFLDKD